jgi:hypothetical protein
MSVAKLIRREPRLVIDDDPQGAYVMYASHLAAVAHLEADIKAEWANLNAATEALRNLVFAVDHVDWDCAANAAMARLDEARSAARAILAGSPPSGGTE